tara:strand:- start:215 stop:934 length:720 start_codon:yes stop_codon:yes gene_type:complete
MLKAKKSLSQNFLIDKNISRKITNQTDISCKNILEIGPGYGILTDCILEKDPKNIFLIEKDINLKNFLNKKYKNNKRIKFIGEDILKVDLSEFNNLIVISNLPYNISTKIILYLFNFNRNINEMIFMIQKEVSQKFDYNLPNMNKYKFLTRIISTYSKCFDVSSKVFIPKPKIKSTVVKFKLNRKKFNLNRATNFSNIIFKNVRKKIYNNLKIKTSSKLIERRVNELTIDEILTIYDFF